MKDVIFLLAIMQVALGAPAAKEALCPKTCECEITDETFEIACNSFEFIKKLSVKQKSAIEQLHVSSATVTNIDSKLKFLKNLKMLDVSNSAIGNLPSEFPYLPKLVTLNLTRNHLKEVSLGNLPKTIQVLDLSNNFITLFPKDWSSLKNLHTVYVQDNPIDCDCSNLLVYQQMLGAGVKFAGNLSCHEPKEKSMKPINGINCTHSILDMMLGDAAEGSGEPEVETSSPYDQNEDFAILDESENLFLTESEEQNHEVMTELEEGSGDEGSGDFIPILPIKACHVNCSTPRPVGADDDKNAAAPPDLQSKLQIAIDDINDVFGNGKEVEKEEPMILKETDKSSPVEYVPTNDTVLGEMERASLNESGSQTAYIVLGLIIALLVFMTIYFINKKKNNNRRGSKNKRNKPNENGYGQEKEMKLMGKSAEIDAPEKALPEKSPLLNGQGKISDGNNVKSPLLTPNDNEDAEDVEVRQKNQNELLTPPVQRVTIKAAEIPDSVPKTPLPWHRQKDGNVTTTQSVY